MAEISGVPTADIDNVDGFFTTQSGGGGGTATTTPTISANVSTFGSGTLTITNASSYTHPSYKVEIDAGGSTIIANTAIVKNRTNNVENGTITWGDSSSVSGTRTVRVRAQEFGDNIQSSEVTTTYTRGTITNRYIRIRGVNSNGTNSSSRLGIGDIEFWTGSARTGTLYPTTHLTSATSETGIEVSMGHTYSSTYANFKACDSSTNTFAWLLGSSAPIIGGKYTSNPARTRHLRPLQASNSEQEIIQPITSASKAVTRVHLQGRKLTMAFTTRRAITRHII